MNHKLLPFLLLLALEPLATSADEFILPPDDVDLIGEVRYEAAQPEDTLLDIARRHGLGLAHINNANPGVDTWLPGSGTQVVLPIRFILPQVRREGLVLNMPEMRLYYFVPDKKNGARRVIVHPISIGRMDWRTPLGPTRIAAKDKDPIWRPTPSLKAEALKEGKVLPDEVPPGPENPLGGYAMRLAVPGYLIHGTNKPFGLGMRVTHGCIRMYPEDIASLFEQVPVNTPVQMINQPVKLGWMADTLFVEVYPPLDEDQAHQQDLMGEALKLIAKEQARRPFEVDEAALQKAVEERSGIPMPISLL